MKNYKEITVWQKGINIVKDICFLVKEFPSEEKFGLISQVTGAAVSIPANIAEGSSRSSDRDYARFIQIALGSAFEIPNLSDHCKRITVGSKRKVTGIREYFGRRN
jgi:four helix bundle protein